MIQEISMRLALRLKNAVPDHPRSAEVLKYGISFVINTFSIIALSLIISIFTGRTAEVGAALISYALLRQVSGGLHLKSGMLCIIVSTAGITALSLVQLEQSYLWAVTSVSLVLALIYAPSRIEKQTKIPARFYPMLKLLSMLIIASNFLFNSSVLAAAFFVQCLTLIRGRR
jgi:accessory gene regulator B